MATRKKMIMEPGRKYRGHGWINEYGQQFFEATQPGTAPSNMKLVMETTSFSIYESKKLLKVSCKVEKNTDKVEMIKNFMQAIQAACLQLKNYEIVPH